MAPGPRSDGSSPDNPVGSTVTTGHVWMFTDDQGRCVEMRRGDLSRAGIELFQPGPN